jgi:hypothetical protein
VFSRLHRDSRFGLLAHERLRLPGNELSMLREDASIVLISSETFLSFQELAQSQADDL